MTAVEAEATTVDPDADQLPPIEVLAARELATLGFSREVVEALAQALDWNRVKKKPGTSFDYIGHADMRRTANRIFGYGGWGYTTDDASIVHQGPFVKDSREGWLAAAVARVTVKLRLADGTWLEKGGTGEGYGTGYGPMAPAEAPGKAVKEAESDALKRAFVNLGDQFGLILYAKEERAALQADAEYNAPADSTVQRAVFALAATKGKEAATRQLVDQDMVEHGHVRAGRLEAIRVKLAALPDPEPDGEEEKTAEQEDTSMSAGHAAAAAAIAEPTPEGAATAEQEAEVREIARKLGPPGLMAFNDGCDLQRREHGHVKLDWLTRQSKLIVEAVARATNAVNGDQPEPSPAAVAEGFGVEAPTSA